MVMRRTRQRARIVRNALAMLVMVSRRDRSLRKLAGKTWWVLSREGLRGLKSRVVQVTYPVLPVIEAPEPEPLAEVPRPLTYGDWVARFDPGRETEAARRHLATLRLPELLVLHVVGREELGAVGRVLASWQGSIHPGWRGAFLAATELTAAERAALRAAAADARVAVLGEPGEVAPLRERAPHTLLCRGGAVLNPLSLYMFGEAAARTGAEVAYADHDLLGPDGERADPAFKPQFSPGYASRHNYLGDCVLLHRAVPLTPGQATALARDGTAGFDRVVTEVVAGRRVEHLPFVLSHLPRERSRRVHPDPAPRVRGPRVSIVVPTRDGLAHLGACIGSILDRTAYDRALVEIVVVDNDSRDPETLAYLAGLEEGGIARVVRYPHPFNFAAINNLGAATARGEILVFLNDDTVVRDPHWLGKLVRHAEEPGAGVVGAKLLFPDGTIQHGGCAAGGNMGTVSHLLMHRDPGDVAATDHTREMSLLTGACWAVRRTVFDRVGGLDPILRVTWNDVKFCLDCLAAGLRNVYLADPILLHDESKTRGADDDWAKLTRYLGEGGYTRARFRPVFLDDPSWNPNRSVEQGEHGAGLAVPPRVRRPWSQPPGRPARIMMLSAVYRFGFGVPLVIQQQAAKLVALGHEVIIAGPEAEREFAFPGCERVILDSVKEAAAQAYERDVSLVVAHTPPFFEMPLVLGPHIPVLAYDYGEPAAEFFPDPVHSYLRNVEIQKRLAAPLTTAIATISQAVKDETLNPGAIVLGLANSHLPAWSEAMRSRREAVRRRLGWDDGFVVLTVCRFSENERAYKGLDKVAAVLREFAYLHPERARRVVFALAGAGAEEDVAAVRQLGFTVFPNVPDEELTDLYAAADAYVSFSRWEGYNLGIAQALAMGLPVAASDIPAHREFGVFTSNSTLLVCDWLAREVAGRGARERRADLRDWDESTARFAEVVASLLRDRDARASRPGASSRASVDAAA